MEQETAYSPSPLELIDQRLNFEKQILHIQTENMFDCAWLDIEDMFDCFESKFRCAHQRPIPDRIVTREQVINALRLIQGVCMVDCIDDGTFLVRHRNYDHDILYLEMVQEIEYALHYHLPYYCFVSTLRRVCKNDNSLYVFLDVRKASYIC